MAKKRVKVDKEVAHQCCPAPVGDYKPRLYLDLVDEDVTQVQGLKVGEKIEILVTGVVKGLEQRERSDNYDGKPETKKTGSISLEGYDVRVLSDDNEMSELAKDD